MNKTTGIVLAIIIVVFGGLLIYSISQSNTKSIDYDQYDAAKIIAADENNGNIGDHARGNTDSAVVLVEYGDMQCAGCGTMMPRMKTIYEEYGDRVAFVFRHYPIVGHPNSRAAAAAIESAAYQGYFWEMLENLYSNQAVWGSETGSSRTEVFAELFQNIAPDANLDDFKSMLESPEIEQKIDFDYNIGTKLSNVMGTPAIYVNGEAVDISNVSGESDFLAVIRSALDRHLSEAGLETGPAATNEDSSEE